MDCTQEEKRNVVMQSDRPLNTARVPPVVVAGHVHKLSNESVMTMDYRVWSGTIRPPTVYGLLRDNPLIHIPLTLSSIRGCSQINDPSLCYNNTIHIAVVELIYSWEMTCD